MTSINQFFSDETIHAVAWTVIHSFWQGLLIALIFSLCYSNMKDKSAKFKYYFSLTALLSIAMAAVFTFATLYETSAVAATETYLVPMHTITDINQGVIISMSESVNLYDSAINFLDANSSPIVLLWGLGLMIFLSRMLYGFYFIKQLRFSASRLQDNKWQHLVDKFLINLGSSKSVEVAESALVKMPMMIGYLKPMILFPIGVVNAMDSKEVEAIIAHELSHVLRNDYLINIIQSFIEVVLYYHPAVWWLSSIIRAERENSCDDMAISMTKSNLTYAKALLHLGQHGGKSNSLAMTFGGKQKKLLQRVQRILNQSQYKPRVMEKIITSTLLFVLIVGISLGANTNDIPAHVFMENGSIPSDRVESPLVSTFAERPEKVINSVGHHFIEIDTLPNNEKDACQMKYYNNNVRVDLWKEDGKIVKLWVDGERIDEADYVKYQAYIDEAPASPPPAPPAPPSGSALPVPPAPPAPPKGTAPPAPPAPPVPPHKNNVIIMKKDGDVFKIAKHGAGKDEIEQWSESGMDDLIIKDGQQLIKIKQALIEEELKILAELSIIDSLYPTLSLSDFEDDNISIVLDSDDLPVDGYVEFNADDVFYSSKGKTKDARKMQKQQAKMQRELQKMKSNLNREAARIEAELNRTKAMKEAKKGNRDNENSFGIDEIFQSSDDNVLSIHFGDGDEMSAHRAFLNAHEDDLGEKLKYGKDKHSLLNGRFQIELQKDGLISDLERYNFKLTNKSFKVNGSRINAELKRKYLDILYEVMEIHMDAQIKYNRTVKRGTSTTTIES